MAVVKKLEKDRIPPLRPLAYCQECTSWSLSYVSYKHSKNFNLKTNYCARSDAEKEWRQDGNENTQEGYFTKEQCQKKDNKTPLLFLYTFADVSKVLLSFFPLMVCIMVEVLHFFIFAFFCAFYRIPTCTSG